MKHDAATTYRCSCGETTLIPERPLSRPASVRAGCDRCERVTEHRPVGSIFSWSKFQ